MQGEHVMGELVHLNLLARRNAQALQQLTAQGDLAFNADGDGDGQGGHGKSLDG
jgi:hypothetical protein